MKDRYPEEKGKLTINGHKMQWSIRRSRNESAFGIRGSRIFDLTILKDGKMAAEYGWGWSKKIAPDDKESALCLSHLIQTYGKEKRKEKKDD